MTDAFGLALLAFGLTLFAVSISILWKARRRDYDLLPRLEALALALSRIEAAVHEEGARTRKGTSEESQKSIADFQESTLTILSTMADLQKDQLESFAAELAANSHANARTLDDMRRTFDARPRLEPARKDGKPQGREDGEQVKRRATA